MAGIFPFECTKRMASPIVLPGQRLGSVSEYASGNGTYIREQHIYASLTGIKEARNSEEDGRPTMQVLSNHGVPMSELVLNINDLVMGKITKITQRHAEVEIMTVRGTVLDESMFGIIRKEDVRSTDIDTVNIAKFFKRNQLVRAAVRSFGDTRAYYLTTARSDLGIITPQKQ